MALVTCPECGRENVSDSAESCPNCGFNIRKFFAEKKQTIFCDITDTNICYTYLDGFDEGVNGIYTSDRDRKYYVKNGLVYLPGGDAYFLTDKFLLPVKDNIRTFEGTIPNSELFNATIYSQHFTSGRSKWIFTDSGIIENDEGEKGVYKRFGDFLIYKMSNSSSSYMKDRACVFAIHENQIYGSGYIKREYVTELESARSEIKNKQYTFEVPKQIEQTCFSYSSSNVPKCPTCGSTKIQKISGTKRWVTTGLFGLASSNVGKTMECKNCGYKW